MWRTDRLTLDNTPTQFTWMSLPALLDVPLVSTNKAFHLYGTAWGTKPCAARKRRLDLPTLMFLACGQ